MDTTVEETRTMDLEGIGEDRDDGRPGPEVIEPALDRFQSFSRALNSRLLARGPVIQLAELALLTGNHLFQLGPAGTGKSLLMDEIARRIVQPDGSGLNTFSILLTKYTTPNEVLGPISVMALQAGEYRRNPAGYLPRAHVAFVDEMWKGGPAILNTLLKSLNERIWMDNGLPYPIPLISMFAASNETPQEDGLLPLYDRIVLRVVVDYLKEDDLGKMLTARVNRREHKLASLHRAALGLTTAPAHQAGTLTLADLLILQRALPWIEVPAPIIGGIKQLQVEMKKAGIIVSDRRLDEIPALLQAQALREGRSVVEDEDIPAVVPDALWNKPEERATLVKLSGKLVNPAVTQATEKAEQARQAFETFKKSHSAAANNKQRQAELGADCFGKLKALRTEIERIREHARVAKVRKMDKIDAAHAAVQELINETGKLTIPA